MDKIEKQMISIVNRNHDRGRIMEKIDRDIYYIRLAKRLNQISERRKK